MQTDNSNVASIILMYMAIFIKYLIFRTGFFDLQFVASSIVMLALVAINNMADRLSAQTLDTGKFLAHVLFISVCFSVFCGIFATIYNTIFYFGFVNTIIFANIGLMVFISGLISTFGQQIHTNLSTSIIGQKLLDTINYYYNIFVVCERIIHKIIKFFRTVIIGYSWNFLLVTMGKLFYLNTILGENTRSNLVKSKIKDGLNQGQNYFIQQVVQPYFIRSFSQTLNTDPFSNDGINISKKSYKANLLNNKNSTESMSFLNNTTITNNENLEDLEDLDDDEIESDNGAPNVESTQDLANLVGPSQISPQTSRQKTDNHTVEPQVPVQTTDQKRAALRKKIREMRAARTGGKIATPSGKSKKTLKKNMANLVNTPGMQQMMKTIFQGDNLEKIMSELPQNSMGKQMPNIKPDQIKQLIQTINNPKSS